MKTSRRAILALFISVTLWSCSENKTSSGDVYFNKGEYEKAAIEYSEDLKFKPNDVRMLYNRGRANEEQGNYEEAKSDFEKALEVDNDCLALLLESDPVLAVIS